MLRIECPCCGPRDHDEFRYGGDASVARPAHDDPDPDAWYHYVYVRKNPAGLHREFWQHVWAAGNGWSSSATRATTPSLRWPLPGNPAHEPAPANALRQAAASTARSRSNSASTAGN